jgi:hypothetical protein
MVFTYEELSTPVDVDDSPFWQPWQFGTCIRWIKCRSDVSHDVGRSSSFGLMQTPDLPHVECQ